MRLGDTLGNEFAFFFGGGTCTLRKSRFAISKDAVFLTHSHSLNIYMYNYLDNHTRGRNFAGCDYNDKCSEYILFSSRGDILRHLN